MATPDRPTGTQKTLDDALAATFPASDPPAMTTGSVGTAAGARNEDADARESVVDVYRVVHADRAETPFASDDNRSGGRWTTPGIPAAYASMSPAGAILEFLAHMDGEKPVDLVLVKARMPGRSVIKATSLPAQWRETLYRDDVREYGNAWIASQASLALDLPSVLCEQSRNLLINPEHDDIGQLKVDSLEAFTLDRRLLRE